MSSGGGGEEGEGDSRIGWAAFPRQNLSLAPIDKGGSLSSEESKNPPNSTTFGHFWRL